MPGFRVHRLRVALLLLAACGAPDHPTDKGARRLPGTERLERRSTALFSLSSAGDLLLLTRTATPPETGGEPEDAGGAADVVALLSRTILYELDSGRERPIRVDAPALRALAQRVPDLFLQPACWSATGDSVYLGAARGEALAIEVADPEWRLVQRVQDAGETCPRPGRRGEQLLGTHGAFVVERNGNDGIRVRSGADPQRVLLEFRGRALAPDAGLREVVIAPGGRRLAIVLSRGQGSFTGPAELFVTSLVEGEEPARSLGGPAYDVRWTPDGTAILAASRIAGSPDLAIYRWTQPAAR